jgi:translation initiation factor 1
MSAKKPPPPTAPLSYNPFASLGGSSETSAPEDKALAAQAAPAPSAPSRAVVRFQRKGHGGKDVTLIEKLGVPAAELESWLRELKASLGCGGAVEEDRLLLQGDQRARLKGLLAARGVRKVTVC